MIPKEETLQQTAGAQRMNLNLNAMLFMSWLKRLPVVFGLLCFAAVVWFGGPLIGIGESRPLEPVWLRVTHHRRRACSWCSPSTASATGCRRRARRRRWKRR